MKGIQEWLNVLQDTRECDSVSLVLQGAAAVASAGVTQTICLPLLSVYEASSNGASQVTACSWDIFILCVESFLIKTQADYQDS